MAHTLWYFVFWGNARSCNTYMFGSIHPDSHYFWYFVVFGTAKVVMLMCLDLFILRILLFYYFAYSQAVMFLTSDIDIFIFTYLDTYSFAESCEFYRSEPIKRRSCRKATKWQKNLKKWKQVELNHEVATALSEKQCHRPQGKFQF